MQLRNKIWGSLLGLSLSSIIMAQSGIYLTAATGIAKQGVLPEAPTVQAKQLERKSAPALRLGVGYLHDLNPFWGVGFEVAHGRYLGARYTLLDNTKLQLYSRTLEFLVTTVRHQGSFDFFLKAGGLRHSLTNFSELVGGTQRTNETKIQPILTGGLNYHLNQHVAFGAEYLQILGHQVTEFANQEVQCPGIAAVLVGVRLAFW